MENERASHTDGSCVAEPVLDEENSAAGRRGEHPVSMMEKWILSPG